MKKYLLLLLIFAGLALPTMATIVHPTPTAAVNLFSRCTDAKDTNCADCSSSAKDSVVCQDVNAQNQSAENPIVNTLRIVLSLVSVIAGVAAVVMIVVSGFRFVVSNGDSSGIKSARESLIYSIVGLAVVLLAQAIIAFVLNNIK